MSKFLKKTFLFKRTVFYSISKMKWPQFVTPVARPGLTGSMEEGDADAANAHEVKFEPGKGKGIQVPPAKKGFINLAAFGIQVGALEGFFIRGIWADDG